VPPTGTSFSTSAHTKDHSSWKFTVLPGRSPWARTLPQPGSRQRPPPPHCLCRSQDTGIGGPPSTLWYRTLPSPPIRDRDTVPPHTQQIPLPTGTAIQCVRPPGSSTLGSLLPIQGCGLLPLHCEPAQCPVRCFGPARAVQPPGHLPRQKNQAFAGPEPDERTGAPRAPCEHTLPTVSWGCGRWSGPGTQQQVVNIHIFSQSGFSRRQDLRNRTVYFALLSGATVLWQLISAKFNATEESQMYEIPPSLKKTRRETWTAVPSEEQDCSVKWPMLSATTDPTQENNATNTPAPGKALIGTNTRKLSHGREHQKKTRIQKFCCSCSKFPPPTPFKNWITKWLLFQPSVHVLLLARLSLAACTPHRGYRLHSAQHPREPGLGRHRQILWQLHSCILQEKGGKQEKLPSLLAGSPRF